MRSSETQFCGEFRDLPLATRNMIAATAIIAKEAINGSYEN